MSALFRQIPFEVTKAPMSRLRFPIVVESPAEFIISSRVAKDEPDFVSYLNYSMPRKILSMRKDLTGWASTLGSSLIKPDFDYGPLSDALGNLSQIAKAAVEEELPEPAPKSVENARTLLSALFDIYPVRYHVSPTERGGVSIDPPMRKGGAVSFECGPDGAVYCMAVVDGKGRRAKFYQIEGLPDSFMREALQDLARG